MRRKILLPVIIMILSTQCIFAGTGLGLFAGLSTPDDQMNDVYNSSKIKFNSDSMANSTREATASGFHIGAKIRYSLSDAFTFSGSAAWHKFPQTRIDVIHPETLDTLAVLSTAQNIIPISVGINYYLIHSFVGIYAGGDLTYNYIYSSVDVDYEGIPVPIDKSPKKDNRVGFGLGAGVDFDLTLLTVNLEGKYNIANFIGKVSDEKTKSFFSLSLGVYF